MKQQEQTGGDVPQRKIDALSRRMRRMFRSKGLFPEEKSRRPKKVKRKVPLRKAKQRVKRS